MTERLKALHAWPPGKMAKAPPKKPKPRPKPKAKPKPKPRKALKIVKQKATHIGRKRPRQVPDWTVKNLRTLARVVKKRKCPPGYSKLKKAGLIKWLKKHK